MRILSLLLCGLLLVSADSSTTADELRRILLQQATELVSQGQSFISAHPSAYFLMYDIRLTIVRVNAELERLHGTNVDGPDALKVLEDVESELRRCDNELQLEIEHVRMRIDEATPTAVPSVPPTAPPTAAPTVPPTHPPIAPPTAPPKESKFTCTGKRNGNYPNEQDRNAYHHCENGHLTDLKCGTIGVFNAATQLCQLH